MRPHFHSSLRSFWVHSSYGSQTILDLLAAFFLSAPLVAFGADDTSNRNKFIEEYEPHAKKLQASFSSYTFSFRTVHDYGKGSKFVYVGSGKVSRTCRLLKAKSFDIPYDQPLPEFTSNDGREIDARNSKYEFMLDSHVGKNQLTDLRRLPVRKESSDCFANVGFVDFRRGLTILEVARDPKTDILAFEDCTFQNRPMKKLTTSFVWEQGRDRFVDEYFFSPEEYWICRGKRFWNSEHPESPREETYFYTAEEAGVPPVLNRIETYVPGIEKSYTEIRDFRRREPFPESDFQLSAFGIPEPGNPRVNQPRRVWLWLFYASAGFGLLAILTLWLRKWRGARRTS